MLSSINEKKRHANKEKEKLDGLDYFNDGKSQNSQNDSVSNRILFISIKFTYRSLGQSKK